MGNSPEERDNKIGGIWFFQRFIGSIVIAQLATTKTMIDNLTICLEVDSLRAFVDEKIVDFDEREIKANAEIMLFFKSITKNSPFYKW